MPWVCGSPVAPNDDGRGTYYLAMPYVLGFKPNDTTRLGLYDRESGKYVGPVSQHEPTLMRLHSNQQCSLKNCPSFHAIVEEEMATWFANVK